MQTLRNNTVNENLFKHNRKLTAVMAGNVQNKDQNRTSRTGQSPKEQTTRKTEQSPELKQN